MKGSFIVQGVQRIRVTYGELLLVSCYDKLATSRVFFSGTHLSQWRMLNSVVAKQEVQLLTNWMTFEHIVQLYTTESSYN